MVAAYVYDVETCQVSFGCQQLNAGHLVPPLASRRLAAVYSMLSAVWCAEQSLDSCGGGAVVRQGIRFITE